MIQASAKKAKNGFLSGVAVLTASAVIVKLIGVLYKIPLVGLVGIEGMAYFLAAYHIYTLLFMISSSGLPVAVSILVSKRSAEGDERGAEEVFFSSLKLFFAVGLVGCLFLLLFSEPIAASIKIPEAAMSVKAIAPALLFLTVGSAVRGYFQGKGDMMPTALSQVIEAFGKLVLGLAFARIAILLEAPDEAVSAAAIAGISVGAAISATYLFLLKFRKSTKNVGKVKKKKSILRDLIKISAPITLGAAVVSLSGVVDTALVSSRLQLAGISSSDANTMYSSYGNLAIPLYNLVPALVSPISVALTPLLTKAHTVGDREKECALMASAIRLCTLLAVPACFGLCIFGEQILLLLYPSQMDAIGVASPLLSVLAPAVLFSCLITLTNSLLMAYGEERKSIISTALGIFVKICVEYFLLSDPSVNIFGAPISTLCCNIFIVCANLYFFAKVTKRKTRIASLTVRPLIAALPSSTLATFLFFYVCCTVSDAKIAFLVSFAADVIAYVFFALWNGSVTEEDLIFLPAGEKIIKIMKKIRLLRNDNEQRRKNNFIEG